MTTVRIEADPVAAVIAFLKADWAVTQLVSGRVHAPELPNEAANAMPLACVILHRTGGPGSRSAMPLRLQRLDIKCYGKTPYESSRVYFAVSRALKAMTRVVVDRTLLHWAHEESGPIDLREPLEDWPMTFSVWLVMAGETEAAT